MRVWTREEHEGDSRVLKNEVTIRISLSLSWTHTHTHTHTYIYIYIYAHVSYIAVFYICLPRTLKGGHSLAALLVHTLERWQSSFIFLHCATHRQIKIEKVIIRKHSDDDSTKSTLFSRPPLCVQSISPVNQGVESHCWQGVEEGDGARGKEARELVMGNPMIMRIYIYIYVCVWREWEWAKSWGRRGFCF